MVARKGGASVKIRKPGRERLRGWTDTGQRVFQVMGLKKERRQSAIPRHLSKGLAARPSLET
jgi:hypothetical protein